MSALTQPSPLLAPRDMAAPLVWRHGQAISAAQFLAQAHQLAARLPELPSARPVNLCHDRLHFALGLVAALLRGQLSLLPPNALPATLRQVPGAAGEVYALVDAGVQTGVQAGVQTVVDAEGSPLELGAMAVHPVRWVADGGGAAAELSQSSAQVEIPKLTPDLNAVCLLTSGSTGAPQPHAKRWGPLVTNIAAEAQRLAQFLGRPSLAGVNVVATVPAQHSYGLESTVLLALLGGAAFESGRPFYPADIARALAQVPQPRALVTTPFHLKTLLLSGVALPPVDLILSATAPLSPQLAAQAEAAFAGVLVEIYGCTEAGQVASRRTTAGEVWTTLGELRLHHQAATEDQHASFVVSGGHVVEPTPLADVLELLDPRHFRLLGRANDLIHVAGKRSSLAHLNFHLNRILGVDDGAFWLPDDQLESVVRPVVFVVAPTLSAAAIVAALRHSLETAFVPRRVVHVAGLPREATGKLTAAALRDFAMKTLAAPTAAPTGAPTGALAVAPFAPPTTASFEAEFTIPSTHPALPGHFPGQPVVPGVVLLSLVMQALHRQPEFRQRLGATPQVDQAKFLAAVRPPDGGAAVLRVRLQAQGRGVAFEVKQGEQVAVRGQLGPAALSTLLASSPIA